jgi:hypothetical protein
VTAFAIGDAPHARAACVFTLVAMLGGCPSSHIVDRDSGRPDAGRDREDAGRDREDAGRDRDDAGRGYRDACPPIGEGCDGTDNDCDSFIDEDPESLCSAAHASATCEAGECVIVECEGYFADCNGDPSDGCEVDLANDAANCRECGSACGAGESCAAGLCDPERVVQIASGTGHHCARRADGRVMCWGRNANGQLGDGTRTDSSTPVLVVGLDAAIDVDVGETTSCALREGGSITCWGFAPPWIPSDFDPATLAWSEPAIDLEVAGFIYPTVCAVGASGAVGCASTHDGHGVYWDRRPLCFCASPTLESIHGLSDVTSLAIGGTSFCALSDGAVVCWGNFMGPAEAPARLDTPERLEEIAGGDGVHKCARARAGDVYCWGNNSTGAVRFPSSDEQLPPTRVEIGGAATAVAVALGQSCAVLASGQLACWGTNYYGALGREPTDVVLAPGLVPGVRDVVQVGLATLSSCARHSSGALTCWGRPEDVLHPPEPFWGLP